MRKLRMSELNRLSTSEFISAEKHPFVIVLDNVRSTLNVGSIFRSADSFKCGKIYLGGVTPTPVKEMNKTALGATEAVEWEYSNDVEVTIKKLGQQGYLVLAIEQVTESVSLESWSYKKGQKVAFVLGNEVTGVSDEALKLCDGCLEIPQFGTKHSLNVAVSAGVVMWDFTAKYLASNRVK